MISVTEALSIISSLNIPTTIRKIALKDATELILSKDIHSPINMPPFRQSAMDGYALSIGDTSTYTIVGEIKAGDALNQQLKPGECVRIFTGARVPDQANSVVIQENVVRSKNTITINGEFHQHQNIRTLGEQIKEGDIALTKGTKLTPAAIGFLAGLGIDQVAVFIPPTIAIITTGNELITPGNPLTEGKIYESNSIQLVAALKQLDCKKIKKYTVKDEYQSTKETIALAIQDNDLVLISGGISVGDYDFVKDALTELKTEELFYKIKQKPGKPLYLGKNNTTLIFALPGNPASSLTCFYIYVFPVIKQMMGYQNTQLSRIKKKLDTDFIKKGNRAQFLKAKISDTTVTILEGQSSSMLYTYAIADALVYIPEKIDCINKGDLVTVIVLPQ